MSAIAGLTGRDHPRRFAIIETLRASRWLVTHHHHVDSATAPGADPVAGTRGGGAVRRNHRILAGTEV